MQHPASPQPNTQPLRTGAGLQYVRSSTPAAAPASAVVTPPPPPSPLDNERIIAMVKNKMPDAPIVAEIKSDRVNFPLAGEDVQRLRSAGVSSAIINAMAERAARDHATRHQ